MLSITLTTAPARYPVTLAEARAKLRLDHQEDDAELAALLAASTSWAETFLNRALISRTYTGFLDFWPQLRDARPYSYGYVQTLGSTPVAGLWSGCSRWIELPRPPLVSVGYIKTYDDSDAATTMDTGDYYVDDKSTVGRVVLRTDASWPTPTRAANGIEIQWTAGYGSNPADVPEEIRQAVLIYAGALLDDPNAEPPKAALALASPHRIWTL